MILSNDVVEILDLADFDIRVMVVVIADDRRPVGAALVDRDLLRNTMTTAGLAQETQRHFTIPSSRQQEVHRCACLVECSTQVFPCPLPPQIGPIQSPTAAYGTLAPREGFLQGRHVFEDPTIKRRMINRHMPLAHHFLDAPVVDQICHIPAHAPQNDITLKMASFERDCHHPFHRNNGQIISDGSHLKI
jgi:hypothetical protein